VVENHHRLFGIGAEDFGRVSIFPCQHVVVVDDDAGRSLDLETYKVAPALNRRRERWSRFCICPERLVAGVDDHAPHFIMFGHASNLDLFVEGGRGRVVVSAGGVGFVEVINHSLIEESQDCSRCRDCGCGVDVFRFARSNTGG
jgi:hypothetical protein